MKRICFVVNVDWFFDSHRKPLEKRLSKLYQTSVIVGDSGYKLDYEVDKFEVKSRVPTLRGLIQLYRKVNQLENHVDLIIVSPVMIVISHFLFFRSRKLFYNFSGLGFLRSKSKIYRFMIMNLLSFFPIRGKRVLIVQNSDDYQYLYDIFGKKFNYNLELIAGSGVEFQKMISWNIDFSNPIIGFVGRIRKDKGILNLIKAINELRADGFKINLAIWGKLDDPSRHGFDTAELKELEKYRQYFKGYSADKVSIFKSFNWFCLPSNGEGLSKAAIEASSFKIPLVLSNVQGNRDMIDDNGYLFEYNDLIDLKSKLIKICQLSYTECVEMSEASFRMFNDNWSLDIVHKNWISILNKYDTTSVK
jgi:glycosyltransferase involved in cell wall biosynthesis